MIKWLLLCLISDGDIEYTVAREMDPDMEDEYEKFIAENEAQWLSNYKSSSWSSIVLCWLGCHLLW